MSLFTERGYYVKENNPVYFTRDMGKTIHWFKDVLGWYGNVVEKDPDGNGAYGFVFNIPPEIEITHLAPSNGIHLFVGEPFKGLVAFMSVHGIDALYNYVTSKNYREITEVKTEPWGAKTCEVRTPDGCVLRFFE
ncbi:MAG TPA: VOC family protein [Anaerolinea sp.]|nr:VOC family protein [Anaerolinea sp.]